MPSSNDIRQQFIDFFCKKHGHAFVPSSPVVPHDDPTLLFANAGMNQFKPYFLGTETPKYKRVANTQKCIRAGGKHNDLDDVGRDTYHHTFFEMLGNWSFGDYFKKEAIAWAWELLTDVWKLDKTRLHVTVFEGDPANNIPRDDEAAGFWRAVGVPESHIHLGNKKDNFWEMGNTGPCGPCTEIHIDRTPDKSGGKLVNAGDARVMEIWNLVFIQFNRGPDGKLTPLPAKHVDTGMGFERVTGVLQGHNNNYATESFTPIIQAVEKLSGHTYGGRHEGEQGARSVAVPAARYAAMRAGNMQDEACRVIADHVRTLTFAITDGAVPDKEGRGYVLRRILRRAVRFGWQHLNLHEPFLCKLVDTVVASMGVAFPELRKSPQHVKDVLLDEERSFGRTLERGMALFDEAAARARSDHHGEIRGEDAFKLHDTYGFPIDLTEVMAQEKGLRVDIGEYERLMEDARARARAGGKTHTHHAEIPPELVAAFGVTDDHFKYEIENLRSTVCGVIRLPDDGPASVLDGVLRPGDRAGIILDKTCFYAEAGGQVGDTGRIGSDSIRFDVEETLRVVDAVLHVGTLVMGTIESGQSIDIAVDPRRRATMKNHTGTHVLNWALREVLGDGVMQKGSLVDHEKTRFDFSHNRAMTPAEIERVEQLCNDVIRRDLRVYISEVPQQDALKINGLRAVFGERYPDVVRTMCIGVPVEQLVADPANAEWRKYSVEFCGGTHLQRTADIEHFIIVSEEAVAKGVRRVVGMTGPTAKLIEECGAAIVQRGEELLAAESEARPPGRAQSQARPPERAQSQARPPGRAQSQARPPGRAFAEPRPQGSGSADALAVGISELQNTLAAAMIPARHRARLRVIIDELQKRLRAEQKASAADAGSEVKERVDELLGSATKLGGTTVLIAELPEAPIDQLKHAADIVKQKTGSAAIVFGVCVADDSSAGPPRPATGGKALLLVAMTDDLVKKGIKAGDLVKTIAPIVEGGGGGPPSMAQAGGKRPEKLGDALAAAREWLSTRLR
jgi:alanyl-tRNA synthetase